MTAVFADLVGSTALGERLDPEDVKLVVGEAVARIIGRSSRSAGRQGSAGDGVLASSGRRRRGGRRGARGSCRARIVEEMASTRREVQRAWGVEGFGVRSAADGAVVVGESAPGRASSTRRSATR